MAPELAHSPELRMLRNIEHNQRIWHWANTEEAKDKSTRPDPIWLDGEEEAYERAVEAERREAIAMAKRLGVQL